MNLKIKKLDPRAVTPQYATPGAACFDISVLLPERLEKVELRPGYSVAFKTGLAFEVPPGYVLKVYSRSGHGFKNGVRLANCVGIIDADYRGELMVKLHNDGDGHLTVHHGDRIAQGMIEPAPQVTFEEVDELSSTERGAGGLGSTGVK